MIILKGISRIYQPKKGVPVKALDKVDLQLPDKGMVFILGKSGSGKSTLLNVVGGLDKYDEGELIVKDKSTKNFSQNDFDSYRNTMVGFIFQEYNVLDDFTVAQNIGLALELQGIKVTNEKVNHILELVDLGGLGARKPNELSGGQKQRVAIARALVKEPEIIMADEPTGALDSETGKQILETLKNLSKTRLVMVVSHDREFANTYGDRIVEFMDGKIISDVSRTTSGAESDTPFQISNNNLEVKAGYTLTPEDLRVINEYLEKSKEDLKITKLEGESNGSFFVTDPDSIKLSEEQYKPIKSRLPFKSSLKIGASSLRHKKIRLTISIILAAVSLTLFGLSDTFGTYKPEKAAEISIKEAGYDYYSISKVNHVSYGNWISSNHVGFQEEDLAELNTKFPSAKFIGVYGKDDHISFSNSIYNSIPNVDYIVYRTDLSGFSELKTSDFAGTSLKLLAGRLAIDDDEVAITKFMYSFFERYGLRSLDDGSEVVIKNYSQILNQEIHLGARKLKVVGVIDTNFDLKPYEKLTSLDLTNQERFALQLKLETELSSSFHKVGFLRSGYAAENITSPGTNRNDVMSDLVLSANGEEIYFHRIKAIEAVKEEDIIFFKNQSKPSKKEDILISTQLLFEYFNRLGVDYQREVYDHKMAYINGLDFATHIEQPLRDRGVIWEDPVDPVNYDSYRNDFYNYFYEDWSMEPTLPGLKSKEELTDEITIDIIENLESATMKLIENDYYADKLTNYNANLVGVVKGVTNSSSYEEPTIYLSENYFEQFKIVEAGIYNTAITFDVDNNALLKEVIDSHFKETGVGLHFNSEVTDTLDQINYLIEMLAKVFIYVGIGFAVFASLMLLNFISISVSYKKQEIGILRAIGARGKDVLGIFTKEAVIIALINYGLALILSIVAVININAAFKSSLNLPISILYFGVRQIVLMFIISIFVAIISSAIPVIKTARKRPIDAIKNI